MSRSTVKGKRLIMHAGMRKTGSSSIQEYLFRQLDHPDYGYLSAGIANSSQMMMEAFQRNFDQTPSFSYNRWSRAEVDALRANARKEFARIARRCDRPTAILSAESISTFSAQENSDLRDAAKQHFDDIQVVMYIRPLWSRVESTFQERLKTGFAHLTQPVPARFERFETTFDGVYGRENVFYRRFSPGEFRGGSVVGDFLDFAGVPFTELPEEKVNKSLSLAAIQLLYIYRKYYPELSPDDAGLIEALGELEGEKFRLHRSVVEQSIDETARSRAWLQARAGISLWDDRGESDSGIRDESELLDVSRRTLDWLQDRGSGPQFSRLSGADPERTARALRVLAQQSGGTAVQVRRKLRWLWRR